MFEMPQCGRRASLVWRSSRQASLVVILLVVTLGYQRETPAQTIPLSRITPVTSSQLPAASGAVLSQEVVEGGVIVEDGTAGSAAATAASGRVEAIRALQIDRRGSTMLEQWAGLSEKPVEPEAPAAGTETAPDAAAVEAAKFAARLREISVAVTRGDWGVVKSFAEGELSAEERKVLFDRLIESLAVSPDGIPASLPADVKQQLQQLRQLQGQMQMAIPETQRMDWSDLLALMTLLPEPLEESQWVAIGGLLAAAVERGAILEQGLSQFHQATQVDGSRLTPRTLARVLVAAGRPIEAGRFLPTVDEALAAGDWEGLNLAALHHLAVDERESSKTSLEQAWRATQAVVLASAEIDIKEREKALTQAVAMASRVRDRLGDAWLESSFAGDAARGREILATIGAAVARATESSALDSVTRLEGLKLQQVAVEALLKTVPGEGLGEWQAPLEVLALNWLQEAEISYRFDMATTFGPQMQRDPFGNLYYVDPNQMSGPRARVAAGIDSAELLELRPAEAWMAQLPAERNAAFRRAAARLLLKVGREMAALPEIEALAVESPALTQELVDEFLEVWTKNHDPNSQNRRTNSFIYFYGFEQRAESIPLTRSKQERNLVELAESVARLRKLPVKLDEAKLAEAFTKSHSSAEVYRLEAIEQVFGGLDAIEPDTLAELAQGMRQNLASVWRLPDTQEQAKTKRRQKDIEAEVRRGYETAKAVVSKALERAPESWSLQLALAAIEHDENDYRRELAPDSEFVSQAQAAFAKFAAAAEDYVAFASTVPPEKYDTRVFDQWLAAAMGAVDLPRINASRVPDLKQLDSIRAVLDRMPETVKQAHIDRMAVQLFPRMSSLDPSVKYRYLKGACELIGEHPQARQALELLGYYGDLVTEIRLVTRIDGDTAVGHQRPFGVFVDLSHTVEIERESGGFGRYLQNQNAGTAFYYNYGRPTENYRDKFEETVRQAVSDRFEVLGIAFESDTVSSRATERDGWRVTPYAYLLLKAKGPEVDSLPPLRLDLDFLDTSGYVVLPVESSILPIDAQEEPAETRPFENLKLTQILDERQAGDGKLLLEVLATAEGLVPELEQLVSIESPGFEVASTDDQGLSLTRFAPENERGAVESQRRWVVTLAPESGKAIPAEFTFPVAKVATTESLLQRYEDADLVTVPEAIRLDARYGRIDRGLWLWGGIGALVVVGGLGLVMWQLRRGQTAVTQPSVWTVPERVDPFVALQYLRRVARDARLDEASREELTVTMRAIERAHFADEAPSSAEELRMTLQRWASRCGA